MEYWNIGKMEYWSIGVMELWKEEKTAAFPISVPQAAGPRTGAKASAFVATLTSADKTAWQGRQNREEWNDGIMCEIRDSTLQILWVPVDLIGHKSYAGIMTQLGYTLVEDRSYPQWTWICNRSFAQRE